MSVPGHDERDLEFANKYGLDIIPVVKPKENILIFDDNGQHPGISCCEFLCDFSTKIEYVSPERTIAPDVGGTNYPAYIKKLYKNDVLITLNHRLIEVKKNNSGYKAILYNEYSDLESERTVDQIVVEHGTLPLDELYLKLQKYSINLGEINLEELLNSKPQTTLKKPENKFKLFRVGDAVSSRNIHSAIFDSLRLCKEI